MVKAGEWRLDARRIAHCSFACLGSRGRWREEEEGGCAGRGLPHTSERAESAGCSTKVALWARIDDGKLEDDSRRPVRAKIRWERI